jgi:4,5-DOPA dioxygenase extradiol
LPLFVALGAAGDGAAVERVVDAYEAGALAMDSYRFDPR